MKNLFIIFASILTVSAFAQASDLHECLEQNNSTVGMEWCHHDEYVRIDKDMNIVLQQLQFELTADPSAKSKVTLKEIQKSQKSFLNMRELQCTIEVADAEGGTDQGRQKMECLAKATQERLNFLQQKLR